MTYGNRFVNEIRSAARNRSTVSDDRERTCDCSRGHFTDRIRCIHRGSCTQRCNQEFLRPGKMFELRPITDHQSNQMLFSRTVPVYNHTRRECLISVFNKIENTKQVVDNYKNFTPGDESPSSTRRSSPWLHVPARRSSTSVCCRRLCVLSLRCF
jgi:hypothetical protein